METNSEHSPIFLEESEILSTDRHFADIPNKVPVLTSITQGPNQDDNEDIVELTNSGFDIEKQISDTNNASIKLLRYSADEAKKFLIAPNPNQKFDEKTNMALKQIQSIFDTLVANFFNDEFTNSVQQFHNTCPLKVSKPSLSRQCPGCRAIFSTLTVSEMHLQRHECDINVICNGCKLLNTSHYYTNVCFMLDHLHSLRIKPIDMMSVFKSIKIRIASELKNDFYQMTVTYAGRRLFDLSKLYTYEMETELSPIIEDIMKQMGPVTVPFVNPKTFTLDTARSTVQISQPRPLKKLLPLPNSPDPVTPPVTPQQPPVLDPFSRPRFRPIKKAPMPQQRDNADDFISVSQCSICEYDFKTMNLKLRHFIYGTDDIDKHQKVCGFMSNNKKCNAVYFTNCSLAAHKEYHKIKSGDVKCTRFVCYECGREARGANLDNQMRKHIYLMHRLSPTCLKAWKCSLENPQGTKCPVMYASRQSLFAHVVDSHSEIDYACKSCSDAGQLCRDAMERHLITQHEIREVDIKRTFTILNIGTKYFTMDYRCMYCNEKKSDREIFVTRASLIEHLKLRHTNEVAVPAKIIRCPMCGCLLNSGQQLVGHYEREHQIFELLSNIQIRMIEDELRESVPIKVVVPSHPSTSGPSSTIVINRPSAVGKVIVTQQMAQAQNSPQHYVSQGGNLRFSTQRVGSGNFRLSSSTITQVHRPSLIYPPKSHPIIRQKLDKSPINSQQVRPNVKEVNAAGSIFTCIKCNMQTHTLLHLRQHQLTCLSKNASVPVDLDNEDDIQLIN